jgi:O-antigen/teichoic acid export membrane protein
MVVVPMILLANFFLGIYHNLSVWYKVSDRTRFAAYISGFGAALTLILNFWLIPYYSYVGSAIATMAAYGSMMLLSYYFGRKYYPIPYDLKRIGGYLLVSISFSVVYFYVFRNNYYIGSILILIFFALIYYAEKDQLKQLLKKA